MNIVDCAKTRYSTKVFDPTKKLTPEQVQGIKDLARYSASSINSQPWHFILAGTDDGKARVAKATQGDYVFNEKKVLDASHVLVFCTKLDITHDYIEKLMDSEQNDNRFPNDTIKDTVRKTRQYFIGLHVDDLKDTFDWMEKQVYLNIGTVLLGAKALGMDAVPIEGFDKTIMDKEFGLAEQGYTSSVIVALGHRSADDFNAPLPKSRFPETEIFTEC